MFDTTRTIVSLLYSGTFSRCADIRFIFPQDGGTMPMISNRIANSVTPSLAAAGAKMPHGAMYELQKLYFDVATATSAPGLQSLLALVGPDHVMFGTDYPFLPTAMTAKGMDATTLSASAQAQINRLTAAKLLPRYT